MTEEASRRSRHRSENKIIATRLQLAESVITLSAMGADDSTLPDPTDAGFYVRYVNLCRHAGVEPSPPERASELVAKWNAMLKRELEG